MVHVLLDHCKCKVKYESISSKCDLPWTRRECTTGLYHISWGAETLSFKGQIFLKLCWFDHSGQLCFEGAVLCGFSLLGGGVNSYCSLSFSGDIGTALSAPLHTHFGGWSVLKPSIPYQIVQKLLGIGVYLSNLVCWRGSSCKFSLCPYFESCSSTQASLWSQQWPAQGHFPPAGSKAGVMRCHPGCCTRRADRAASCWCCEFVWGVALLAAQASWLGEVWYEWVGLDL